MSWLDAVEDGRGVLAVWGGQAPALTGIDVQALNFSHNGPTVVLAFTLPDYPTDPPAKWAAQGFDTAQMALSIFGIADVRLTGWDVDVVGDLTLERVDGRVAVRLESPAATFSCTALAVDVQTISAYQRERQAGG